MMLKAYTATPLCSLLASSKTLGRVTRRLFLTASFPEIDQFNAKLPPERKIKNYQDLHKFSIEQNEEFWSTLAKTRLQWFKPFNQVRSGDFHDEYFRLEWFLDGKLNASGAPSKFKHLNQVFLLLLWLFFKSIASIDIMSRIRKK